MRFDLEEFFFPFFNLYFFYDFNIQYYSSFNFCKNKFNFHANYKENIAGKKKRIISKFVNVFCKFLNLYLKGNFDHVSNDHFCLHTNKFIKMSVTVYNLELMSEVSN